MFLFDGMTDDQIALVGCALTLCLSGGLMVFTHSLRRVIQRARGSRASASSGASVPAVEPDAQRKAA